MRCNLIARRSKPKLPADFDPAIYLELNPDVAKAGDDAALHYLSHGIKEGRRYRHNSQEFSAALTGVANRFCSNPPKAQNIVDIFDGEWSSAMPTADLAARPGHAQLFDDHRIKFAQETIGPFGGMTLLELGPLEGAHSYMLHGYGANVVAVEGNQRAFLRCLCVKEIYGLSRVRFMLGDFVEYLETSGPTFDAVIACGVLYHMTNPLRLLRAIVRRTDRVMLWTHYYDDKLISKRSDAHLFSIDENTRELLGPYDGMRKSYAQEALDWSGFSGGQEAHAIWLRRESIGQFFRDHGYEVIEGRDEPDHPNGPCITLCARRRD